jgi:hypothetical protein
LSTASARVGGCKTGSLSEPVFGGVPSRSNPTVFFLLDQRLAQATLGTDADLGRVNFELFVFGDLGTGCQGFTPVADSLLPRRLPWLLNRAADRIILDQVVHCSSG